MRLEKIIQVIENQVRYECKLDSVIEKSNQLIKDNDDIIKKMDEQIELLKQISELNRYLDSLD